MTLCTDLFQRPMNAKVESHSTVTLWFHLLVARDSHTLK